MIQASDFTGTKAPLVEMHNISKAFGAVRALSRVHLTVAQGEALGLVGDNAAGKSTLMKILAGAHQPDSGQILVNSRPAIFTSPIAARQAGIEMIYQDFALVPQLTVTQNIFLGRERVAPAGFLQQREMNERAKSLFST